MGAGLSAIAAVVGVGWMFAGQDGPPLAEVATSPAARDAAVAFVPNQGQWSAEAHFHARTPTYDIWLADTEVVFATYAAPPKRDQRFDASMPKMEWHRPQIQPTVVRMALTGAHAPSTVTVSEEHPGVRNYYLGDEPERWRSGVPTYGRVRYSEAWEAVDLVFRGNGGRLEYDVVVRPGGDPREVALTFTGADDLALDPDGNLVVRAGGARLVQRVPTVYQEVGGERVEHQGRFVLLDDQRVGFWVDDYDPDRDLVIDPEVLFGTVLGGSVYEEFWGIAASDDGSVLLGGVTVSPDFPTRHAYQDEYPGDAGGPLAGTAVVTRYGPDGEIRYSTYLGGSGNDVFLGAGLDGAKRAYVGGASNSGDHPYLGGQPCHGGFDDMTLAVLAPNGKLLHATCLGGSGGEFIRNLVVEKGERGSWMVYAEGGSDSYDFPIVNGFQPELGGSMDGAVLAYDPDAAEITYSSFFGGSAWDIFHSIDVRDGGIVGAYARFQSFSREAEEHWHRVTDALSEGRGVWWCGEYDPEGWETPPGYGNSWLQALTKSFDLPAGAVSLDWVMQYDTEPGYDYVLVQVDGGMGWATLAAFDGMSEGFESFSVDLSSYAGTTVDLRIAFSSDVGWSDEDGIWPTNGAVRIDEATVTGHPTDDFESGGDGWLSSDVLAEGSIDTDYLYGPGGGGEDGAVVIVDTNRTGADSLLATARIGGTDFDNGLGLAFGVDRDVFVTGITCSTDAPATPGAAKTVNDALGCQAHAARLSPDLSALEYYTYVGGSVDERPLAITVNDAGEATVSGMTQSADFPTTADAPFPAPLDEVFYPFLDERDGFATTVSSDGSEFVFSSYFGGSGLELWGSHAEDKHGTLSLVFQTQSTDAYVTDDTYLAAFQSGYIVRVGEPREDIDPDEDED